MSAQFRVGEHVDCLDTVKKWLNGEVQNIRDNEVFIHYTGYVAKYDEWIDLASGRVQKQWRRGAPFSLNNRIDALDQMGKWLPASIVEIFTDEATGAQTAVKVHFQGYKPKWDEVFPLDDQDSSVVGSKRIREIGAFSGAHGWAKFNQAYQD